MSARFSVVCLSRLRRTDIRPWRLEHKAERLRPKVGATRVLGAAEPRDGCSHPTVAFVTFHTRPRRVQAPALPQPLQCHLLQFFQVAENDIVQMNITCYIRTTPVVIAGSVLPPTKN
jgi:hypothetical protein